MPGFSHRDPAKYMALLNDAEVNVGRAFTYALELIVEDIESNAELAVGGNYQSERLTAFRTVCERCAGIVLDLARSKGSSSDAQFLWAASHAGEIVNTGYDPDLPDFHFMTVSAVTSLARFAIVARDEDARRALEFYEMMRVAGQAADPADFKMDIGPVVLGRPLMSRQYRGVWIDVRRDP